MSLIHGRKTGYSKKIGFGPYWTYPKSCFTIPLAYGEQVTCPFWASTFSSIPGAFTLLEAIIIILCVDYWSGLVSGLPTSSRQSQSISLIVCLMSSPKANLIMSSSWIKTPMMSLPLDKVWIPEHGSLVFLAWSALTYFSYLISLTTPHAHYLIYSVGMLTFLYFLKLAITSFRVLFCITPLSPKLICLKCASSLFFFIIILIKLFICCLIKVDLCIFLTRLHEHGGKNHDYLCDLCILAL